jgi:hypothetical protein
MAERRRPSRADRLARLGRGQDGARAWPSTRSFSSSAPTMIQEIEFARDSLRWRKPDSNHRSRGRPPPSS